MANVTEQLKTPLGVGGVISRSFQVFFSRFALFFLLAFLASLVTMIVQYLLIGREAMSGQMPPEQMLALISSPQGIFGIYILPLLGYSIATAMIVIAAYDAQLGRPMRFDAYFNAALTTLPAVLILSLVALVLTTLGAMLLILPGLYLYAMFSVTVPAIVIERVGFRGLGRSAELTKEYRWPVLGVILILFAITLAIGMVMGLVVAPVLFQLESVWPVVLLQSVVGGVTSGFMAVALSVLYARLREIKEGAGVDSLADIFS